MSWPAYSQPRIGHPCRHGSPQAGGHIPLPSFHVARVTNRRKGGIACTYRVRSPWHGACTGGSAMESQLKSVSREEPARGAGVDLEPETVLPAQYFSSVQLDASIQP